MILRVEILRVGAIRFLDPMKRSIADAVAAMGRRLFPAVILILMGQAGQAHGQTVLDRDTFDTDLSGWAAAGDPAGQTSWDGSRGSPAPGSLRLSVPAGAPNGAEYKSVSQCRSVMPETTYVVQSRVRPDLGVRSGRCFAVPVFYDQSGCQGEGSITGSGDVLPEDQWSPLSRSATSFASSVSMRAEFFMVLESGTGPAACNLDDVALSVLQPVPTLDRWAVLLLILLVAFAAGGPLLQSRRIAGAK